MKALLNHNLEFMQYQMRLKYYNQKNTTKIELNKYINLKIDRIAYKKFIRIISFIIIKTQRESRIRQIIENLKEK